jgi:hypothetical protein
VRAVLLLGDVALRRAMAERGYQRAHEAYSWVVISNKFQCSYETVAAEHWAAKELLGSIARAPQSEVLL